MPKRTTLVGSLCAVAFLGCGDAAHTLHNESKVLIVNGQETPAEQTDERALSTVALTDPINAREGHSWCTATLIAPRVLVTAAHCAGSSAWASFGTKVSEPALIRVVKKVSHPKFARAKMQNDVALYLLEKEAPITHKPAKIFEGSVSEGDVMAVAGFGITKFRGKNDTGILRQADVFVKKINTDPTPEIILAGKNGEDTCQGDSGGPAYVWVENHYEVLGVTSWGNGCGVEGHYTDLRAHSTFIAETLASFEQ